MSSKNPIDIYSKEEIEKRIKSIISDTLVKEHERTNSLATRYKSLQVNVFNTAKNCKTTAAQGETPDQTKERLLKTLEKVDKSLSELNLTDNAGFKPDTTSLSINLEREETPDNNENTIRIYKLDQNSIKEEPYESTGELIICPICPKDPPKLCKGQTGPTYT
jgi:hypothetical protein